MNTSSLPGELERGLFARLLADTPFQPATNYLRAVELAAVCTSGLPGGQGLDLGCGDGRLTRLILDRLGPRSLVGVDPDPLETASAAAEGIYERVHTARGDRIPEADCSFDWIFSNSVLEHIPDIEPVLVEVRRLLRPGGQFIFTVPSDRFHDCLSGPWSPLVSRQAYLDVIDRRCAHVRYWGSEDWRRALTTAQLELVSSRAYLSPPETRRWETMSRLTAGVLYTLTGGRRAPIQMQRGLGLRGRRLNLSFANALARLFAPRAPKPDQAEGSCLLVIARRPEA
jgi:SAM-dependent methyltransferase